MKLTKEQALEQIKTLLGEKVTEDASIKFLEDITDTLQDTDTDLQKRYDDLQKKYDDNEAAWRKKYTDRFFTSPANDTDDKPDVIKDAENEIENEANAPKTFDDLFKESEK